MSPAPAAEIPVRPRRRDLEAAGITIEHWLRRHLVAAGALRVTGVSTPDSAGVANETLMVETQGGPGGSGKYVVRVDSEDHLFLGMDLGVHYRMYRQLGTVPGVPVPATYGFEVDRSILGDRFFVMEWVEGQVPSDRPNFNREGWLKERPEADREAIWRNVIGMMARFHALEPGDFAFLARPALGPSGLEQEMRHWLRYADWCSADRSALLADARCWLTDHFPDDPPTALSWGDARLQNIMVRGTECVAMFDWDMVSLAGPEADLAWWALADHKYTYSRGLDRLTGIGSPAATIALWEQISGRKARDMDWHLIFAAYRQALVSVRLPELTRRLQGLSRDEHGSIPASAGLQWLSCLLDKPLGEPLTTPFVGLDR